ncbi:MAG: FAD:protein FMN transferase [Clostridiales bacterium]|nr:FAD:protein FMN transferase [Clostridiales bacterium]MDD7034944.1 FAD:protein FMN transferase [Bacillota bacterium]MDY2920295.1 FAD:protein FMN transferase [Lentihominibacter sp.]
MFKKIVLTIMLSLLIISQTGCGNKEAVTGSDEYLDTVCEITLYGCDEDEAQEIITGGFRVIADNEALLSKTVEGSDVDRINDSGGKAVKVSDITAETIATGLEVGELSGGDFDITIGRLTDLWDFKSENPEVPSETDIRAAAETVDYRQVDLSGNRVRLNKDGSEMDLGGIAKGYIADLVTEYLEKEGVESGIVNLGGNVVAIGSRADGEDFTIGIERPYSDRTEIIGSVSVSDKTVVTSGIYERKFEKDGVLYHHILDPETGFPADTDLEAVTIVADRGYSGFCDALSTACLMAGADGARTLVEKIQKKYPDRHIEALFIDREDNVTETDGMKLNPVEE